MEISNANKRMIERFFNNPTCGVAKIATERAKAGEEEYAELICAIIESGFEDLDVEYIRSHRCAKHCEMIFFDYLVILYAFNKLHYFVTNQMDWNGK